MFVCPQKLLNFVHNTMILDRFKYPLGTPFVSYKKWLGLMSFLIIKFDNISVDDMDLHCSCYVITFVIV